MGAGRGVAQGQAQPLPVILRYQGVAGNIALRSPRRVDQRAGVEVLGKGQESALRGGNVVIAHPVFLE